MTPNNSGEGTVPTALPELKGCPFCGGRPRMDSRAIAGIVEHRAHCPVCEACGPADTGRSTAVDLWNRRASGDRPPTEPVKVLDATDEHPAVYRDGSKLVAGRHLESGDRPSPLTPHALKPDEAERLARVVEAVKFAVEFKGQSHQQSAARDLAKDADAIASALRGSRPEDG